MNISDKEYLKIEKEVTRLLKLLKKDIGDEYRATDDPEETMPGMQVTIGVTADEDGSLSWNYQTGDNSFTGGAYGHRHWGVIYLYRRSNSAELAHDAMEEIAESIESYNE